MDLETGKTYEINHTRKGRFTARVTGQDDEWVDLEVVAGQAGAILSYNRADVGEPVTVRKSFITSAVLGAT